jgi:hypothetical protein
VVVVPLVPISFTQVTSTSLDVLLFVPISAKKAFDFRAAGQMSFAEFQSQDIAKYDQLGREEVGRRKWENMSIVEKYSVAYEAVANRSTDDESLKVANFKAFLVALTVCLGVDDEGQLRLLQQQTQVALEMLTFDTVIIDELREINSIRHYLKLPELSVHEQFWEIYHKCIKDCIDRYAENMDFSGLHTAMEQLIAYDTSIVQNGDAVERDSIVQEMMRLICLQINGFVDKAKQVDRRKGGHLFADPPPKDYRDAAVGAAIVVVTIALPVVVVAGAVLVPGAWQKLVGSVDAAREAVGHLLQPKQKSDPAVDDTPLVADGVSWDALTPSDMHNVSESIVDVLSGSHVMEAWLGDELVLALQEISARYYVWAQLKLKSMQSGLLTKISNVTKNSVHYAEFSGGLGVRMDPNFAHGPDHVVIPEYRTNSAHWGHLAWMFRVYMETR